MLRVVDSGLRPARENLSLTEALRRLRAEGCVPDTLRFQRFPRSALVGRHQLLRREVHLDWTAAKGVEVARRMTGGGAIVMGPGILGWELILGRGPAPASLEAATAMLCEGVAEGLRALGLAAAYRPRNDIEVGGRKVSGTGGYVEDGTLVFQGTVLVELDIGFMASALRLPTEKLGRRGLEALAERVADLRGLLGTVPREGMVEDALAGGLARALGIPAVAGDLTAAELDLAHALHEAEIGTDRFVEGLDDAQPREGRVVTGVARTPGGTVEVVLKLRDGEEAVVDQAIIAGDFFAAPPGAIPALEASLRSRPAASLAPAVVAWLKANDLRILGVGQAAFAEAIAAAATAALERCP